MFLRDNKLVLYLQLIFPVKVWHLVRLSGDYSYLCEGRDDRKDEEGGEVNGRRGGRGDNGAPPARREDDDNNDDEYKDDDDGDNEGSPTIKASSV